MRARWAPWPRPILPASMPRIEWPSFTGTCCGGTPDILKRQVLGRIPAAIGLMAALLDAAPAVEKLLHVRVPMRDKVRLDTNVFHPGGTARYPAILIRTPYGKGPDLPA